jgi:hypothetical protein
VLVLAASPHPAAAKQPVSAKAYEQLGFTGLQSCADCDVLGEYVKDEGETFSLVAAVDSWLAGASTDTHRRRLAPLPACADRLTAQPQHLRRTHTELVADCKRHCVEDKAADDAIYTSAKLVVCPFKLKCVSGGRGAARR